MLVLLSLALATCIFASDDDRSSLASDDYPSDDEYVHERNRQDWATPELREEMNFWLRPESREEIPYAMRGWDEVVYEIEGCPNTRLNGRYMPQYQPNTDPGMRMFGCWAHSQDMGKEDHESRKLMFWHAPLTCDEIGCEDACDDWHTRPTWILADPTVMSSDVFDDRAAEATMYVAEGRDPQPRALDEMEHSLQQPAPTEWNVTMGCANGWRRSPVAAMRVRQLHIETARDAAHINAASRSCRRADGADDLVISLVQHWGGSQYLPTPQQPSTTGQQPSGYECLEYLRSNVQEFAEASSDQQATMLAQQATILEQLRQSNAQEFSLARSNAQDLGSILEALESSAQQQSIVQPIRRSNAQDLSLASSAQQSSSGQQQLALQRLQRLQQLRRSNAQTFSLATSAQQRREDAQTRYAMNCLIIFLVLAPALL